MEVFDIGDKPVLYVEFREAPDYGQTQGALANPSAVEGLVRYPDGTEAALSAPTNVSTGVYKFTLPTLTQEGPHLLRARGTAGVVVTETVPFTVRNSPFTTP